MGKILYKKQIDLYPIMQKSQYDNLYSRFDNSIPFYANCAILVLFVLLIIVIFAQITSLYLKYYETHRWLL